MSKDTSSSVTAQQLISKISIDPEFRSLIPPMSPEERAQLEANIEAHGCREPLVVWVQPSLSTDSSDYQQILLDGHNRLEICTRLGIDFDVDEYEFDSRDEAADWIDKNQLGRRNLKPDVMSMIRGRIYNRTKKAAHSGENQHTRAGVQNEPHQKTAEALATQHGVSAATIKRDGQFAQAVEKLEASIPGTAKLITSGAAPAKQVVIAAAKNLPIHPKVIEPAIQPPKATTQPQQATATIAKAKPIEKPAVEVRQTIEELAKEPDLVLIDGIPDLEFAKKPKFNRTNENIDWAKWSWNPVTGCEHTCSYCYARDIANRFYKEKFEPTFRPERLTAPQNTTIPKNAAENIGEKNVFVGSMADLFGDWVPQEWIDAVMQAVRNAPQWNFLFLSKNPKRMATIDWPKNSWVGTTVDINARVKVAEMAFAKINAPVKWLSCEPLLEDLKFSSLKMFDWVVIGAQSKSTGATAFQPKREWVHSLMQRAYADGCKVYCKPNLLSGIKEYPEGGLR